MRRLGFMERWVNLIMTCVRTANYAILVNGNPVGHIGHIDLTLCKGVEFSTCEGGANKVY